MDNKDKFSKIVSDINKNVMRVMIGLMTLSLILASVHLIYLIYERLVAPPYLIIEVTTLYEAFNLVLIIAVGYELTKSLILIISSDSIPTVPIIQIAIIAVANKIITLDTKHSDANLIIGLAVLIAALGMTHFLLKYKKKSIKTID